MTGSLQVKNGKYYMVLNSTENGKRKQKWISTGLTEKGNKRKAEQMLRETLRFARAVHQEPSLHKMVNETLEAMAKGYAAERNWSLSRLKLPANPLRRKSAQKEKEE